MAFKDTAAYLPECLDSIIEQTYPNWELLAVDDHSTDGSRAIVEKYAQRDARVRVVSSEGQRLVAALQTAMKHLSGTLINRMDSDDRMPDDKLEVMVQAWQQMGKGHVIAGGTEHFVEVGEVGDGFKRYDRWLNAVAREQLHTQEIYRECVLPSHCWMMHRDDFESIGGFDSPVYPEDYDLCFRIYQAGYRFVGLDKVLHHWRDRTDRISRTWDEYKDNRYFELKLRYFLQLDRNPQRPLVLWGAGRNGKDMAKLLIEAGESFTWICDNPNKIGKDIYGVRLVDEEALHGMENPQIMLVMSAPDVREVLNAQLTSAGYKRGHHFWWFL